MHSLAPHYERKTRADRGTKRPRESNAISSSTTQNHPSSSHPLNHMVEENDDESFHSNSSSPSQQVSSSSNVASRVRQNPSHESHDLNTFLSETITLQTQQRNAHRDELRSIGQALKNMMGGKRKYKLAKGNVMRGSHWSKPTRIDTRIWKEAHQEVGFYTELLVKEAQRGLTHGMPRWQSVCLLNDPTVIIKDPMIGNDWKVSD
ncbi:hypothetical protein Tco_1124879 [Tanacetum coccineum]|uniref:Uncharacterized protein n=1 Tax=Tanacetum coccineum TaxID=301880 RepID=A0ABQ5J7S5_9ASTR